MSFNRSFGKLRVYGLLFFTGDCDYEAASVLLFVVAEESSVDFLWPADSLEFDCSWEDWSGFPFFLFFEALIGMFFLETILISELLPFATFLNIVSISISSATLSVG